MTEILHKQLSDVVVKAAFTVHLKLGPGLNEVLYKRALAIELEVQGAAVKQEKRYTVFYRERLIGNYFADVVVDNVIIIETKAVKTLNEPMNAQIRNYLRISGLRVGYLFNFFGTQLQFKRLVV